MRTSFLVATRKLLPVRDDWTGAGRSDLTAGIMVALVALPLALGFGVASGMGARAGLITAIVAGVVAGIFGGSRVQVSGPTGAMTVVLIPIVAKHGVDGVLVVTLLAGAILLALSYAGAGRFIHYVPVPVVEGFTLGIAAIIALQQVPTLLAVAPEGENTAAVATAAIWEWLQSPSVTAPVLTLVCVLTTLAIARVRPGLPGSLAIVLLATAATRVIHLDVATIGAIPAGLPTPHFPTAAWGHLDELVIPAIAIAALAALESLLSATVADAMTVRDRHDPNRELFGQGLANLATSLFGGIPATAAIARTAVNVRSGARTRLATVVHASLLLIVILVAAPLVAHIPLAALAGVLIATAVQMVRFSSLVALLRATRGDGVVLVATALATIAFDLVTAVLIGLILAGFLAVRQTAQSARLDETPLVEATDEIRTEEHRLLDEHIVAYRIDGPLFFAAAHDFLLQLVAVTEVRVVILRMSRVTTLDATGAVTLGDAVARLERRGITVLLSGIRPEHHQVLQSLGTFQHLAHENHVFADTPDAIAHARKHAARAHRAPV